MGDYSRAEFVVRHFPSVNISYSSRLTFPSLPSSLLWIARVGVWFNPFKAEANMEKNRFHISFALPATLLALGLLAGGSNVAAQATTKDIVLMRVSAPPVAQPEVRAGDAMAVSVLLDSADGTLTARGTDWTFKTGDRLRVKVVASRTGKLWLFNTTPDGVLQPSPVWQGTVRQGQELITPRMRLEGRSGLDQLHVVLEPDPTPADNAYVWLRDWLAASAVTAKDIRIDVQNTPSASYLLNAVGRGLVTTVNISHR